MQEEPIDGRPLPERIRGVLLEVARTQGLISYRELASRLGLRPPLSIHRVTTGLEALMAEDATAGRPLLAALCVSRMGHGLPTRGFFIDAAALGLFSGDPEGPEARAFHTRELARVRAFYGAALSAPPVS